MNRTDKFQVGILSWYIKRLSILSLTNGLILFVLRLRQQGVGHWWTALYNIAVQQRPRSQAAAEYPARGWEGFHSGKRGAFSFPYARKAVRQCLLDRRMIEWRNRDRARKSITYHRCSIVKYSTKHTSDCLSTIVLPRVSKIESVFNGHWKFFNFASN